MKNYIHNKIMTYPNELNKPSILQKLQWVADPVGYMESAKKHYPDIFSARVVGFGDSLIFVSNPQAIQEILTSKKFTAPGDYNHILKPLAGDYSVIMLNGDRHRKRRQLLLPPFHGERMRTYSELICHLTEKVMKNFPFNKTFSAREATQQISLQVILEAVYGLHESESCQNLKKTLTSISELFRSPLTSSFLFFPSLQKDLGSWSPWGNFIRERKKVDQLLYAEIAQRRENTLEDGTDILSMLMSARDEEGQPMTDQELRDELMLLMFAGHETTATAMAWALYWIHRLPSVKAKLLAEIDSLGTSPDPMSIAKLPYLSAVCNETLRIYPVAMLTFPRVAKEPVEILGQKIDAEAILMGCIYLTHHREDLYPDSYQFKPERFLEKQFTPYEFMPFGGGARRCIGEALANLEMKLVLATILSRYELALADNNPERPQRRGVTLGPANGVKIKITGTRQKSNQTAESELVYKK